MPTYEYTCTDCGQNTEAVQAFSDAPLEICPNCGGSLKKVFGSVGIVFKGSGFYKNDSRPKKESKTSSKSEPSSPKPESSSETKEKAAPSNEPAKKTEPKTASATT